MIVNENTKLIMNILVNHFHDHAVSEEAGVMVERVSKMVKLRVQITGSLPSSTRLPS